MKLGMEVYFLFVSVFYTYCSFWSPGSWASFFVLSYGVSEGQFYYFFKERGRSLKISSFYQQFSLGTLITDATDMQMWMLLKKQFLCTLISRFETK